MSLPNDPNAEIRDEILEEYEYRLNDLDGYAGAIGKGSSSNMRRNDSQASTFEPLPTPSTLRNRGRANKTNGSTATKTETPREIPSISSLDFERVVNEYSIQATRDRVIMELDAEDSDDDAYDYDGYADENDTKDGQPLLHSEHSEYDPAYNTFDEGRFYSVPPPPPAPVPTMPPPPPGMEKGRRQSMRKPGALGYTGRTATRWVLSNAVGVMTGLISIFIVTWTDMISSWRSNYLDSLFRHHGLSGLIFLLYAATNLALALLSACLCLFLAPEAVGSGIPEIKAYLNGVRVKRFSSMRLFFVTIFASILSISSGLAIGPEGPLVHIGAIVGAGCTKLSNTLLQFSPRMFFSNRSFWSFVTMDLSHFAVDSERRDLVSIGAAAGFAAAFGAPIGGLLFSLEEASTFFDQSMFLKTLTATALATFCLAVHHGNLSNYSIISLGNFNTPDDKIFLNRFEEFPLYVLIAIGGGVLGGIFCRCFEFLQLYKKRLFPDTSAQIYWRLAEVTIVSLLTSILTYFVPLMKWACRPIDADDDLIADSDKQLLDAWKFHAHQFNCPHAEINELATVFFGAREDAISDILTDPTQFHAYTLVAVGVIFFVLMTLTLGVSLPSGIFMPTFLIGSSLGGAAGIAFQGWIPELSPSTFALLGAAALLAGIQRSTVSLCVILVEGTGQVKILIPVIVTVVVARYVGDLISHGGLYEIAMEVNKYPYLDHGVHKSLDIFQVSDIMSTPVVTLRPQERAHTLVKILRESEHNGFPIVDPITKKFLGLVRRDQLVALLECGVFDEHDNAGFDDEQSSRASSGATTPSDWTPKPGMGKTPMMELAYHIKDDRFDHILEDTFGVGVSDEDLARDDFDTNAWLVSIRQRRANLTFHETGSRQPVKIGDDSLPPLSASSGALADLEMSTSGHRKSSVETGIYAIVGTTKQGNVYLRWLDPECKRKWVSLGSVMNRGTYSVVGSCPVSKAHHLFTALGLRHLIVLGGQSGGEVVGILTRINLLKESIQERTGCEMR
jgi:H+/Cl- antiporter ClcA